MPEHPSTRAPEHPSTRALEPDVRAFATEKQLHVRVNMMETRRFIVYFLLLQGSIDIMGLQRWIKFNRMSPAIIQVLIQSSSHTKKTIVRKTLYVRVNIVYNLKAPWQHFFSFYFSSGWSILSFLQRKKINITRDPDRSRHKITFIWE